MTLPSLILCKVVDMQPVFLRSQRPASRSTASSSSTGPWRWRSRSARRRTIRLLAVRGFPPEVDTPLFRGVSSALPPA